LGRPEGLRYGRLESLRYGYGRFESPRYGASFQNPLRGPRRSLNSEGGAEAGQAEVGGRDATSG
jgi:hypothetical protein